MNVIEEDFLRCPKCFSDNWIDIANLENRNRTRFMCFRCRYIVLLKTCKKCSKDAWSKIKGFDEKGGYRPYYRFKCDNCGRIIKIKMYK